MKLGRYLGWTSTKPAANMSTVEGRRRAWREMLWNDHGFLRTHFTNLHPLSNEMWRSNQPQPRHFGKILDLGIRTIINLRGESPKGHYLLEKEVCEAHDISLINFKVRSREIPTPEIISGAEHLFDKIEYPALMHCKSGADRAGLMSVLYCVLRLGMPVEQALHQLSLRYLHMKWGKTGILDFYFQSYLSDVAVSGESFGEWAKSDGLRERLREAYLSKRKSLPLSNPNAEV